jgi:hypothetical protein
MTLNRTMWPPFLYIYDDLLIYRKRNWFRVREATISYNQVSGVETTHGIFFAKIEIYSTGIENIIIKFVYKNEAKQAKRIIDQKIFHSHAKHQTTPAANIDSTKNYEHGVNRLKELLAKRMITEKEFEARRKDLLKQVK